MPGNSPTPNSDLVVIIPTLDEELHIARAARSVLRLGHVLVVDSGSEDATRDIASELGCEVIEHTWEGYAAQKNWALNQVVERFRWVLFLDADEWVSDALADEINHAIASSFDGFHVPRRNIFEGRALRHAWWYPDYQLRLFRSGRGRFEDRLVHEHVIVDGRSAFLRNPILHENLKGIEEFVRRHARYADLEAQEMLRAREAPSRQVASARLMGSWPERRRWLKLNVWYRIPYRPVVRFLWMFVVKRGFLDGRQGLVYCQLIAAYEAMIDARLLELERARGNRFRPSTGATSTTPVPQFVCPVCRLPLAHGGEEYLCGSCTRAYPIIDGIPVLLADGAVAEHEDIDQHGGGAVAHGHKAAQAQFTDVATSEDFEIDRPHGTPRLYQFLLREKIRRATAPIAEALPGATALVVCAGSGMDAEFLARAGTRVVASDISFGAARRTRERARRYGIDIVPVVADVEALPFPDQAFDLVFVHDGLHHLERPKIGLTEIARVARRWVSVTEPARAAVTRGAVILGLAMDREPAGNRVERLSPSDVTALLAEAGFDPLHVERYAMYYHHAPGRITKLLSREGVYPIARSIWRIVNAMIGGVGNKMVVVSERRASQSSGSD
jgi:glycosyltransferase involved in cell wall biosynthesis/SAM-dependent methyltransferase/uncharacterized protein YbaR (Trm112 family)